MKIYKQSSKYTKYNIAESMHVMKCKYNSANRLNEYGGITHANW